MTAETHTPQYVICLKTENGFKYVSFDENNNNHGFTENIIDARKYKVERDAYMVMALLELSGYNVTRVDSITITL